MGRTPDRFPGEREDEGLLLVPDTVHPMANGEIRYVTGQGFKFFQEGVEKPLVPTDVVTGVPPNFEQTISEGNSATTSATYQNKLTLTTSASNIAGTYYILWYSEFSQSNANGVAEVQILVDGVQVANYNVKLAVASSFVPFPGFSLTTLIAGSHTIQIQFRSPNAAGTVTIKRSRLGSWRVA